MAKFIKKPIVVEAVQWTGVNKKECLEFCPIVKDPQDGTDNLIIPTLEGDHICSKGDWIIRGIKKEFYPIKNEIFKESYVIVE